MIEIVGGARLVGKIPVSGAKNAALPMLMASLLTTEECTFSNVPNLQDVSLTLKLLEHLGSESSFSLGSVKICTAKLLATEANYSLVKALRASFWVLGPLLARGRAARVALPGGDMIGARPVDLHLEALEKMGASIAVRHGIVYATAVHGLKPAKIDFRFPSVGATHQILMAAALVPGVTRISGAACEPEVVALAEMLQSMGAEIDGAGTSNIVINGKSELSGANIKLIGDRIEAGTYLLAACSTKGSIEVDGVDPEHLKSLLEILDQAGADISVGQRSIKLQINHRLKPINVTTRPYPGFPTDLQAPLLAALCFFDGQSSIEETIFEGRFGHVAELCRMGADIKVLDRTAIVKGLESLSAAQVDIHDIRAGAALVIAALGANGRSQLCEIQHLRRGYEALEQKFTRLGARISLVDTELQNLQESKALGCD